MTKHISNKEHRLLAAIILSGICANYARPIPSPYEVDMAVRMAGYIIDSTNTRRKVK